MSSKTLPPSASASSSQLATTSENRLDYELYLWALERHGLQAAYAPLVSEAGPAE